MVVGVMNVLEKGEEEQTKKMDEEDETKLRLGLPSNKKTANKSSNVRNGGSGVGVDHPKALIRKRGFSDLSIVTPNIETLNDVNVLLQEHGVNADPVEPPSKVQIVGCPPIWSIPKNMMAAPIKNATSQEKGRIVGAVLMKVSMDRAPYLRKLDLRSYKGYRELLDALHDLFSPFACINGKKDAVMGDGYEYTSTYEDKDGNWMLVEDVPWEMFVGLCKRLRMMKGNDAIKKDMQH